MKLARLLPLLLITLMLVACGSASRPGVVYFVATPGSPKLCAQGRVRGRIYHVLGYKQSQFRFSNYLPSPVPAEFLPGPCPAIRDTNG